MNNLNLITITALSLACLISACNPDNSPLPNDPPANETTMNVDETDKAFIGLTKAEAEELAKSRDLKFRVVKEDGEYFIVTEDYRLDRVNAVIVKGKITETNRG